MLNDPDPTPVLEDPEEVAAQLAELAVRAAWVLGEDGLDEQIGEDAQAAALHFDVAEDAVHGRVHVARQYGREVLRTRPEVLAQAVRGAGGVW